eukprot:TRINITY_DN6010_c0_g1_i2.p1 TRINITY_DN6010_c0_g1~~TRINITY_DN6010_c0_g1_i2.p1  ORF type:complete len:146 (+),score=4.63 TRINITY_DN6010_c0_g1_i2:493-930(+)
MSAVGCRQDTGERIINTRPFATATRLVMTVTMHNAQTALNKVRPSPPPPLLYAATATKSIAIEMPLSIRPYAAQLIVSGVTRRSPTTIIKMAAIRENTSAGQSKPYPNEFSCIASLCTVIKQPAPTKADPVDITDIVARAIIKIC